MKLKLLMFVCVAAVVCTSAEFVCKVGIPYRQNDCNDCVCDSAGVLGCTDKLCSHESHNLEYCKVGDVHLKGCNSCWCVKGYGTICTHNKC